MKKLFLFFCVSLKIFFLSSLYADTNSFLKLKPEEIEHIFLENNLLLIAEKLNTDIADASILQAKLRENPTLSVNQVNLWSTDHQREGEKTVIPPLFGNFGRNTEFNIELSQLIQTAGKRSKLIEREKLAKEMTTQEFEEFLRSLKIELRKIINDIIYQQSYLKVLENQKTYFSRLSDAYTKQVSMGNIAKNELLRLRTSYLEYENEIYELQIELEENQKQLKILMGCDPLIRIEVIAPEEAPVIPENLALSALFDIALDNRPENKYYQLQYAYALKDLKYEKSLTIPDLEISINYDRYGGVWKDFIGFGVSIDLPVFNRNQGNIKTAGIRTQQIEYQKNQFRHQLQQEVVSAYNNYKTAYQLYHMVTKDELLLELDDMLEIYVKNLLNKNISMLEYIDFMEAYKNNKQIILNAEKNLYIQLEELKYIVGKEL